MSEAKKAGTVLESVKVIPFYGTDTTKGGVEPREFFKKAEVFAATKGFKKVLLEEGVTRRRSSSKLVRERRFDKRRDGVGKKRWSW